MQHPLALPTPASNMSAWPTAQAVHPAGSRLAQPFNPASTQVLPRALPTPMVHATPHDIEMEQGNITQTTIYQGLPMPMSHVIPYDVEMVNGDTRRQTIVHELPAPMYHATPCNVEMEEDSIGQTPMPPHSAPLSTALVRFQSQSQAPGAPTNFQVPHSDSYHANIPHVPHSDTNRIETQGTLQAANTYHHEISSRHAAFLGMLQHHMAPGTAPPVIPRAINSASDHGCGAQAVQLSLHQPLPSGYSQQVGRIRFIWIDNHIPLT